jgi:hypothetical protein
MMLRCSTESGPASHSHSHYHAHPNTIQMAPFGNDNRGMRTPPSASIRDPEPPGAPRYRRCAYLDSPTFQAFADPADPAVLVRVDRSRFQGMVGTSPRASARSNRSIDHSHIPSFAQARPRQDAAAAATSGASTPVNASTPGEPRTDQRRCCCCCRRCCCRRCLCVRCCGPTCACQTHDRCRHRHPH